MAAQLVLVPLELVSFIVFIYKMKIYLQTLYKLILQPLNAVQCYSLLLVKYASSFHTRVLLSRIFCDSYATEVSSKYSMSRILHRTLSTADQVTKVHDWCVTSSLNTKSSVFLVFKKKKTI